MLAVEVYEAMTETARSQPVLEAEGMRRQRIAVVGIDGSKPASQALSWAADEARMRGATLRVVLAWHVPAMAAAGYIPAGVFAATGEEAARILDSQVNDTLGAHRDVPVEPVEPVVPA
jgi:nucleotide-binding universal stress UspA family protein